MDQVSTAPLQTRPDAEPTGRRFNESPEFRRQNVRRKVVGIVGLLIGVIAALLWLAILYGIAEAAGRSETYILHWELLLATIIPTVLGLALGLLWYGSLEGAKRDYEERLDRERTDQLRAARDAALPVGEAKLARLLSANRDLLDEYQRPVRRQARTSYTFAQIAIFVGLLLLIGGVVITLLASDSSAKLGVAGVAAVGAAVSGYVARTYLRVYERAQDQLNFYFREPLISSYLLTAERLAEKLTGNLKDEVHAEMVREMVRAFGGDLSVTAPEAEQPGAAR